MPAPRNAAVIESSQEVVGHNKTSVYALALLLLVFPHASRQSVYMTLKWIYCVSINKSGFEKHINMT